MSKQIPTLHAVEWSQVANRVKAVNAELYDIISELSPGPEYRLYLGRYPFGCNILKDGLYQVPSNDGQMLSIKDQQVPKQVFADLSYNQYANPATLLLKNGLEIYMNHPVSKMPVTFRCPTEGVIIHLYRIITNQPNQPTFLWNVSAGARSLFMLPKISQSQKYNNLRTALNIDIEVPTSLADHWRVFRSLATYETNDWSAEVLTFSKKWFEKLEDPAWVRFRCFLLEMNRKMFDVVASIYTWDKLFDIILQRRNLRPSLYINNLARHIFHICIGRTPGMAPAVDEKFAPIKFLQDILINVYSLKNYIPTIMAPSYFLPQQRNDPVYYSLQSPGLMDTLKKKDNSSILSDLYSTQSLLAKYLIELKKEEFNIEGTPLHDAISNIEITAFHPNSEKYSTISDVERVITQDKRFQQPLSSTKNNSIALHSTLFKGCFQLRQKKQQR